MNSDHILALDFGTSNSLAGAARAGKRIDALKLDPFSRDPSLMRSLLYFANPMDCYFGSETIPKYIENEMEGRLFRSFKSNLANKSFMGTQIGNRVLSLEDLISAFIVEIKRRSEVQLGSEVHRVVCGKPARYSLDPEIDKLALDRMKKALETAGFTEIHFVPEPLAAALDYRRNLKEEKIVLIGDFGGGTSDFTLIKLGSFDFIESEHVLGIDGCPLAGDALDSLFMSQKINDFFGAKAKYQMAMSTNWLQMPLSVIDRLNQPAQIVHLKDKVTYEFIREVRKCAGSAKDRLAIDRLFALIEDQQIFSVFETIEFVKRELSTEDQSIFNFDYPDIEIACEFKREEFENWAMPSTEKIFSSMESCLKQGGLSPSQVDLVSLTGGTSQVPHIRKEFERRFGREKLQTQAHFHSVLSGLIESAVGLSA